MFSESTDLEVIKKHIHEKRQAMVNDAENGNTDAAIDYCKYLESLYSSGYIGYVIFASGLAGLFSIEDLLKSNPKFMKIASLGADTELPDDQIVGGKETRELKIKELQSIIPSL